MKCPYCLVEMNPQTNFMQQEIVGEACRVYSYCTHRVSYNSDYKCDCRGCLREEIRQLKSKMTKQIMVDAIIGGREPKTDMIKSFVRRGLGRWIGGFIDEWQWDRKGLSRLEVGELETIYKETTHLH